MSDHPIAARYRELTAALDAGDMGAIADSISDDVEWWEIGASEPVRGKQALVDRMEALSDFEISVSLHDVLSNDDHLIALLNVTARKGGESLDYRTAEIHHFNADGQITQRWAFSDDTQAIIEFFG
jgi:ketosteroid isomerase-like protein